MKDLTEQIYDELNAQVVRMLEHSLNQASRIAELEAQIAAKADTDIPEALELLAAVFDAWENGDDCYEDPGECAGFLGKAFRLDDDIFNRCVELLNRRNPPRNAAPHPADTDKLREAIMKLKPHYSHRGDEFGSGFVEGRTAAANLVSSTALQAPVREVPGWQPIETAPKDGTMFIGWVWSEIYPDDEEGYRLKRDNSTADFCQWCDFETGGCFIALAGPHGDSADWITHWMPLPSPPVQEPKP